MSLKGIPVAGTIHPHTGDCRLLQSMICILNCWDHRWYWRYTSHHILAENLISLSTEDGRKCSILHFMCLAQVLEKPVLPVFTEAENCFYPSLLALIFPMLLFLSEVMPMVLSSSLEIQFNCVSGPPLGGFYSKGWFMKIETHLPNDVLRAF